MATKTVTFYPTSFDDSASSYYSASNQTAPIGVGADSTAYATFYLSRGSGAITRVWYNFDLSSIPANATIVSVTARAKAYISSTTSSYVTTRQIQLFSGSTAKGSAYSIARSTTAFNLTAGTWTREELENIKARIYCVRGSTNTTSNYYVRLYGVEITVEYEDIPLVTHTVTVQANGGITTDAYETNEIADGNPFEVSIFGNITNITDNGNNVLNQLVERTVDGGGTLTRYPTAYRIASGTVSGTNYQNAIGKGSSATASGNDYSGSSGSTANIEYSFDFSAIPENAVITGVEVLVGGHLESTSNSSEVANLQLYSGSTAKGSQSRFTTTSKQIVTMSAGSWSRAELQNAKLVFTIGYYGGLVNGVDFNVTYEVPEAGQTYHTYTIISVHEDHDILINMGQDKKQTVFIKTNGAYSQYGIIKKIFRKSNGKYIEIEATDIDTNVKYRLGEVIDEEPE